MDRASATKELYSYLFNFLKYMPKTRALNTLSINPSLISFTPRQVLLAKPNPEPSMNKASARALKPEQKVLLLRSVAGYLKSNGFSKTLKKFLSEAQIEVSDGLLGCWVVAMP